MSADPAVEAARERQPRAPGPAPIMFVGGTGRSGTHVIAGLIGRHRLYRSIPVECRFHVEPRGFPGLLDGSVSPRSFLRRLRGFWWRGFQTNRMRGLYRFVPRERFDEATAAFEANAPDDLELACRQLFLDLLMYRAEETGAAGIVEQSCDTVAQASTLVRLFPEARFVHVCRDGRDASASRVAQTRGLTYPRTRRQGINWWEERIRRVDAGARAIPGDRLLEISLEEALADRRRQALVELVRFMGVRPGKRVRRYFWGRMSPEEANVGRWQRDLSPARAERVDRAYLEALDRLEADSITCVPLLRRAYDRHAEPDAIAEA